MVKTDPQGTTSTHTGAPAERPADYVNRRAAVLLKHYSHNKEHRHKVAKQLYGASQYQLMLVKFKKHRIATISVFLLGIFYLTAILAEFVAPYDKSQRFDDNTYASPTAIHFFDAD